MSKLFAPLRRRGAFAPSEGRRRANPFSPGPPQLSLRDPFAELHRDIPRHRCQTSNAVSGVACLRKRARKKTLHTTIEAMLSSSCAAAAYAAYVVGIRTTPGLLCRAKRVASRRGSSAREGRACSVLHEPPVVAVPGIHDRQPRVPAPIVQSHVRAGVVRRRRRLLALRARRGGHGLRVGLVLVLGLRLNLFL